MLISYDYITFYTPAKQALQIVYILKKYLSKESTIVDSNAGMGGNSIYFCKYFKYVYCIDNCIEAISFLEHNLKDYNNKLIIQHNCLDIFGIIKYDLIFLDPPWGGSLYKFKDKVNLYVNNVDINIIIERLYFSNNIIALKAPNNFNINYNTKWKIHIHNIYKDDDNQIILFKLIIYLK